MIILECHLLLRVNIPDPTPQWISSQKSKWRRPFWRHEKGYLMGPYSRTHHIASQCRINPVFCVPKPDGRVRPVVNFSKKINGQSLNDLLDPDLCTVEYIQLKEIVYTIQQAGPGAMVWAKDLEDGYFNIKIKPEQTKSIAFGTGLCRPYGFGVWPILCPWSFFCGMRSTIRLTDRWCAICSQIRLQIWRVSDRWDRGCINNTVQSLWYRISWWYFLCAQTSHGSRSVHHGGQNLAVTRTLCYSQRPPQTPPKRSWVLNLIPSNKRSYPADMWPIFYCPIVGTETGLQTRFISLTGKWIMHAIWASPSFRGVELHGHHISSGITGWVSSPVAGYYAISGLTYAYEIFEWILRPRHVLISRPSQTLPPL